MTTTISKQEFFRDYLVPTGQVLEVLLFLLTGKLPRADHTRFAHEAFEPLNMASLYAANPANCDLMPLARALTKYASGLLAALAASDAFRPHWIATAFGVSYPARTAAKVRIAEQAAFMRRFKDLQKQLPFLAIEVGAQMGYSPSIRHSWTHQQMAVGSPLTATGRANKWRTFVRNKSWDKGLALLDMPIGLSHALWLGNRFSHRAGLAPAAKLWDDTFSLPTAVEASVADDNCLPAGIRVVTTAEGRLQVVSSFGPQTFLTAQQFKVLQPVTVGFWQTPSPLKAALAARDYVQTCEVLTLAGAVENARAWLVQQEADKARVLDLFERWHREVRLGAVRAKVTKHFNPAEQLLLAEIFSKEAFHD